MKVKLILPALTEAKSPYWRPVKYSLFPPLGLATLAGYLADADEIDLQDEARAFPTLAVPGPEYGVDAAFQRDGAGEAAIGRRAQQSQRLVEIGLADAIGADEHRDRFDRQMQLPDRAIAVDRDGGEGHLQRPDFSARRR